MSETKVYQCFFAAMALFILFAGSAVASELNIYSARHYDADKEVYEKIEAETGIKVNVVEGKGNELLSHLSREKDSPKADLFLTVGAESIYPLKQEGLISSFSSKKIEKNIPKQYRGSEWIGITSRARIIAYDPSRTKVSDIKTYGDLTDKKWNKKILVHSSSSSYNLALLASIIQLEGKEKAYQWAKGVVENMATEPKGNDRDQAKGVAAGTGDIAIMNSYYYVRMLNSSDPAEAETAKKVRLLFLQPTHLNLSFAAFVNKAANKENAIRFMEFLSEPYVQNLYAEVNGEFPLNPSVKLPKVQASWEKFKVQKLNFELLGSSVKEAAMIFDKIGWK